MISIKINNSLKVPFGVEYVKKTYNAIVKDGHIFYPDKTPDTNWLPTHIDQVKTDEYSIKWSLLWLKVNFTNYPHDSCHLDIRIGRVCLKFKYGPTHFLWIAFTIGSLDDKRLCDFYQIIKLKRSKYKKFEKQLTAA